VVGFLAVVFGVVVLLPAVASARVQGRDGGMPYYGHVFPVQGPHGVRGGVGVFHAGRSAGRIHEGFDITAACGTELVAVRDGRVLQSGYDPVLYGWFLLIHGEGERRSYFYAHMPRRGAVHRGERVWEGEPVGAVGETGNATGTGCHLHFEIHVDGVAVNPEALLRRWDRYS
jgi:murein DD-endopeptidase MepM/ murein hydrolase activator NlpD